MEDRRCVREGGPSETAAERLRKSYVPLQNQTIGELRKSIVDLFERVENRKPNWGNPDAAPAWWPFYALPYENVKTHHSNEGMNQEVCRSVLKIEQFYTEQRINKYSGI